MYDEDFDDPDIIAGAYSDDCGNQPDRDIDPEDASEAYWLDQLDKKAEQDYRLGKNRGNLNKVSKHEKPTDYSSETPDYIPGEELMEGDVRHFGRDRSGDMPPSPPQSKDENSDDAVSTRSALNQQPQISEPIQVETTIAPREKVLLVEMLGDLFSWISKKVLVLVRPKPNLLTYKSASRYIQTKYSAELFEPGGSDIYKVEYYPDSPEKWIIVYFISNRSNGYTYKNFQQSTWLEWKESADPYEWYRINVRGRSVYFFKARR